MNILVVDDDPIVRLLIRGQLSRLGYDVREVVDGELAWDLLRSEDIPILITDWLMPSLDGPGLIKRIRGTELPRYIYIILLTIKGARADVVAGLDAGADDYLVKPVDPNELRARVAIGARIIDLERRLREARDTDSLTGVRNRRALVEFGAREVAARATGGTPASVLLLDVDHFKEVNDQYGHAAGDTALRQVAGVMAQHIRASDVVGRWGGEELLVILPNTPAEQAALVAERVRAAIAATTFRISDDLVVRLTASIGVASTAESSGDPFDSLVERADRALYRAKRGGRNQVVQITSDDDAPEGPGA